MAEFIIDEYEIKKYLRENLFHREDGPAVMYPNGDMFWYQYGWLSRQERPNGRKRWIEYGKVIWPKL